MAEERIESGAGQRNESELEVRQEQKPAGRIKDYTVIDLEMTGLAVKEDKIMEIGAARVRDGLVVETYSMLVNPHQKIPTKITQITGITNEMVADAMEPEAAISGLLDFIGDDIVLGQNVSFDYSFLKQWAVNQKRSMEMQALDTLKLARYLLPPEQPKNLESLCRYYGIERLNAHRALDDALETQKIYEKMADDLEQSQQLSLLAPRTLCCKIKKQTPATKHQVARLKEFREQHGITGELNWDTLTRSQASRQMDLYYLKYGRG